MGGGRKSCASCLCSCCNCCLCFIALILVAVGLSSLDAYRRAWKLEAGEAAEAMWERWVQTGHGKDLPDSWRGIFWMATNPAPELLTTLDVGILDASKKVVKLPLGEPVAWGYCSDSAGWLEYWAVAVLSMGTTINFEYNENMTFATMPMYLFGVIRLPASIFGTWTIEMNDPQGLIGFRGTYNPDGSLDPYGSYVLKKVIDKNGNKLPAFDEMLRSLREKWVIKNTTIKTEDLLVYEDWCGDRQRPLQGRCPPVSLASFIYYIVLLAILWLVRVAIFGCCETQRLEAATAAQLLYDQSRDSASEDLPEKLLGVFWVTSSATAEVLVTAMPGSVDRERRKLTLSLGQPFTWSYERSLRGWLKYLRLNLLSIGAYATLEANEGWTEAELRLFVLWFIPVCSSQSSKVRQLDQEGHLFALETFNSSGAKVDSASFPVKKVIGGDGSPLPALEELQQPAAGTTRLQLVHRGSGCRCCCRRRRAQAQSGKVTPEDGPAGEKNEP